MASSKLTASSSSRNWDTNRRSSAKSAPITDIRAHTTATATAATALPTTTTTTATATIPTNSGNRGSRDLRPSKNKSNSSASMNVTGLIGTVYDESPSAGNSFLDAEFTLIDASAASDIVIDAECPPPLLPLRQESFSSSASQSKTVDDVWKEIVAGRIEHREYKEEEEDTATEMMTLEDFLAKASAAEGEEGGGGGGGGGEGEGGRVADDVKMSLSERLSDGIFSCDQVSQSPYQPSLQPQGSGSMIAFRDGNGSGNGSGVEVNGGGRGKRRALQDPMDKAAQQRQRRMIKNRESAARSRERKQAYQVELESLASKLEVVNEQLLREMTEHNKARFKQLMEKLVPVVEKRKPARPLRRVQSMQW